MELFENDWIPTFVGIDKWRAFFGGPGVPACSVRIKVTAGYHTFVSYSTGGLSTIWIIGMNFLSILAEAGIYLKFKYSVDNYVDCDYTFFITRRRSSG
jgi:hypothetical protein